jgi:rhomboid family GlyGly-CTERM serine protease
VPALRRYALFLALAAAALAATAGGARALLLLAYERQAIARGEVWRAFTGHLVHAGPAHLILNLAGLAVVALCFGREWPARSWALLTAATAAGCSTGVFVFEPRTRAMVGLSGLLHGLMAAGAVGAVRRGERLGWLVLAVLAVKIASEQLGGPSPASALLGGPIATGAHFYGAVAGVLAAALLAMTSRNPRP